MIKKTSHILASLVFITSILSVLVFAFGRPAQNIIDDTTISSPVENKYYQVVKIVDGDTIDVNINGKIERIRLIGIDTPETVDNNKPIECFGPEATKKAKELLSNQQVRLEADPNQDDSDTYNRLLRYVFRDDGLFFNEWMITNGYAHEFTFIYPYKYQTKFKQAELEARNNNLGMWEVGICD